MKIEKAINILAENVNSLNDKRRIESLQRRNAVVDLYGYEFSRLDCDATHPAIIGISISQDLIYYSRYEFKIVVQKFNAEKIKDSDDKEVDVSADFRIYINDVDLTPYFKAQFDGNWFSGVGTYPTNGTANYDVLLACGYLPEKDRNKVLRSGYNEIKITGTGTFDITLVNYLKYSHVNR